MFCLADKQCLQLLTTFINKKSFCEVIHVEIIFYTFLAFIHGIQNLFFYLSVKLFHGGMKYFLCKLSNMLYLHNRNKKEKKSTDRLVEVCNLTTV